MGQSSPNRRRPTRGVGPCGCVPAPVFSSFRSSSRLVQQSPLRERHLLGHDGSNPMNATARNQYVHPNEGVL